ncbi:tensin-2 isoform X2 [Myxocyprinus asiaticus]|uniref:tensin-2 isoform X2 n=1 Tax=Myxocyprinus asiaticus TaxID=70543 RepID=UPI002223BFD5|nr:tensin-2 isoform X2 [Myxocyprinus asiaticus]
MGCVFSKQQWGEERNSQPPDPPKTRDCTEDAEILSLTELGKVSSHSFKERYFMKKHHCAVCRQTLNSNGMYCRECKTVVHKKCEAKVSVPCEAISNKPQFQNQMNIPPSRDSVDSVMERLMDRQHDFDLTYITERIISVLFLSDLEEQHYSANMKEVAAMLKCKHQNKVLLINLSEKRHDICRLNPKVEEFGWPDLHAPPLDKICAVCKSMESWLTSDPQNVVVLHCKGNKGKTGVIVAAYMHYSKISAGADQALSTVAMRKFCEDKITPSLQPSQNRYIYYFASLLSGAIKMNSSSLFLHQIHIPALLNYQSGGASVSSYIPLHFTGYSPFLKIYQSLQLVYSSAKYDIQGPNSKMLCVNIEPALLLKGDILVKCYHCQSGVCKRECMFRVQFHTCSVHGSQLTFGKEELDHACTDDRFPADAKVELVFSSGPQRARGGELQWIEPGVNVDYSTTDSVVRWDSYENFNLHHQDSVEDICHTRGPLDGSLYAQVKKRHAPESSPSGCQASINTSPHSTSHSSSTPHIHLSIQPLSLTTDSNPSSSPSKSCSLLPSCVESEKRVKDEHRETAILDDGDCSPLRPDRSVQPCYSHPYSHTHLFCSPDLTSPHALAQMVHPKHHTLPCNRTASLPVRDLRVSQPDLLWERGRCLQHACSETVRHLYSYPTPEMPLSHSQSFHSHSLPPQTRSFISGEACPLIHCSALPQGHTHIPPSPSPNQSLISSPYRELRYSSAPPTSCFCQDCSRLREDVALHSLRGRESEGLPWSREEEFGFRREGPVHWRDGRVESHWEGVQNSEYWRRKTVMSPVTLLSYGHCHTVPKQDPAVYVTDTIPEHITPVSPYPSPQSSGYHSPHPPCPCSPQPFKESPGYASISHSTNSSPLAFTPSPRRASHNNSSAEDSQHCTNDGGIKVFEADKSHNKAFSSPNQDSRPLEAEDPVKSTGQEDETLPGSLITVVTVVNAETTEKTEQQHSEAKKTPFIESTSNTAPSCPYSTLTSKGVESVQVHTYNPSPLSNSFPESKQNKDERPGSCYTTTSTSTIPPICSSERSSASEFSSLNISAERQSLTPLTDCTSSNGESSNSDFRASSPDPDGYVTPSFPIVSYSYPLLTVPHVPYTGYTAVTIPASLPQPPLPEKQRSSHLQNVSDCTGRSSLKSAAKLPTSSAQFHVSFFSATSELPATARCKATPSSGVEETENRLSSKFVQDSSKYWYKPGISRDQAIAVLKDKEPGCFLIRDSNSFQGAYGLALKVATPPAHASNHGEMGSPQEQLVRHFLIESGAKGVKIKGCQNETYFGSLSALVYQHSITPVSLPCVLRIPDRDLVGDLHALQSGTNTSTAADLLKQGAACNVLYLNSVETESLTGPQAVSKATKCTLTQDPRPSPTIVHFKVSTQGITLTDNQRRLFFRRHYPIHSVTFSSEDPMDQRMFGFVARRSGGMGNVCHLFAELDPEQPAKAIVNFINKVMLGPQQLRK